ncbi:inner membrane protein [Klebsiella pneumoniae]|nr:inner membrane protein [Klebsiella pneumoniae]
MGLLIKGLLGALVVVLIGVLAKTKNYAIAGLVPLFPTFALIAHYIVASERGIEALRATIVFGMWSILPYFIYLLSLWYFTGIMRLPLALAGAVGMLGAVRLAVNPRLEPFPLAQRAAAVDSE